MQAITVRDRDADVEGLSLTDIPYPHAAENDVIVRVHAAGFTPGELDWPSNGPTGLGATGRRACPATSWRVSSSSWGTEPPDSPSASGCSD